MFENFDNTHTQDQDQDQDSLLVNAETTIIHQDL